MDGIIDSARTDEILPSSTAQEGGGEGRVGVAVKRRNVWGRKRRARHEKQAKEAEEEGKKDDGIGGGEKSGDGKKEKNIS